MSVVGCLALGALCASAGDVAEIKSLVGKTCKVTSVDKFHGFDRVVFDFKGCEAWVVCPPGEPRADRPWTWCMQWATAFVPRTNVPQMLRAGYHHVTIKTFEHRMDETGLKISADFQKFLVETLKFAPKANLIGMSWGGFFSVRYANRYPQNVAKIYLDAPLLCFSRFKIGIGPWENREPPEGWAKSPEMPVNMAESIARAKIPVLLLYGGQDRTCVPEDNCEPFARRFRAAGGDLQAVKRGLYAHHPHGVELNETTIMDFFERVDAKPVAAYPGRIGSGVGWKTVAENPNGVEYLPFEGTFPTKGGRIESPRFALDKTADENAWYALSFEAKSATNGYWWVDFFDGAGALLPDVNSRLDASADWRRYDVPVPTRPEAVAATIAFVSKGTVEVRDVTMRRIRAADAADRIRRLYDEGPQLEWIPKPDCWKRLPNARTAIQVAKNYTIVFLGDSIMNDTWCGGVDALLRAEYPDTNFRNVLSVRGSTGCWFYRKEKNFNECVAKYKPDLVVIGGVSNWLPKKGYSVEEAEAGLVETIERCRKIGAEVALCSPGKSCDPRTLAPDAPELRSDYHRRAAERTGVQFWDLTTAPVEAVRKSGKPIGYFNRDVVHSDQRGKVLNATALFHYFQSAQH